MGLQLEQDSWEATLIMNSKALILSCLAALPFAAPAADADADAQFVAPLLAAPHAAVVAPASNCVTEEVSFVTQVCTPSAEEVCSEEIVETEEIEYEKICKEVLDTICDAPIAHTIYKCEADADAQFLAPHALTHAVAAPLVAPAPLALPTAHAVAHSVTATVKHACREVTTKHCVDNPKVKLVPVTVKHCHTVTKVTCEDVDNKLPKTTCEAVETTHVAHAAYGLPVPHIAAGLHY